MKEEYLQGGLHPSEIQIIEDVFQIAKEHPHLSRNKHILFFFNLMKFFKENGYLTSKQKVSLKTTAESIFKVANNLRELPGNDFSLTLSFTEKYGNKDSFYLTNEIADELQKIENKHGVYFLFDSNEDMIYVGKSLNLAQRLLTSASAKKADAFSYIITQSHMDCCILELYYISKYKPKFNRDPAVIDEMIDVGVITNDSYLKESTRIYLPYSQEHQEHLNEIYEDRKEELSAISEG